MQKICMDDIIYYQGIISFYIDKKNIGGTFDINL